MKIGIITIHSVMNYGAMLQAYATQKIFSKYFEDVSIIDYRMPEKQFSYSIKECIYYEFNRGPVYLLNVPRMLWKERDFLRTNSIVQGFINSKLNLSKRVYREDITNVTKEYDAVIVGSDQVWKPTSIKNNGEYLLDFFGGKKYSFASSFGTNNIDSSLVKIYKNNLQNFNMVSTRELQGKKLLENVIGIKNVEVVLDPTLMISGEEWLELSDIDSVDIKKPYILVYMVKPEVEVIKYAQSLKDKTGYNVEYICTPGVFRSLKNLRRLGARINVTPQQWIGLINGADYIITNSFHGIAFSMNLQKQFFISFRDVGNPQSDSRLRNVVEEFGLQERVLIDETSINTDKKINYTIINERLEQYRKKTEDFIIEMVKDIEKSS